VSYLVLAILDRRGFRRHWKVGLLLGLVIFALALPSTALSLLHFDPSALMEQVGHSGEMSVVLRISLVVGMFIGLVLHLGRVGWVMALYVTGAVEWGKAGRPGALEGAFRTSTQRRELFAAFCFGVAAGSASILLFFLLGVDEGVVISRLRELFPGLEQTSWWVLIPVVVMFMTSAAITEELVFRGGLLGLTAGRDGGRRGLFILAAVVLSAAWAVLHLPNTSAPLVKFAQIFLLGLCFSALARRSSVYAAIAAHVGLNLTAGLLAFALSDVW
jgi:membrane protease YdiL (CAAX protease family)